MTKQECDIAGSLGILVIRKSSEKPPEEAERYRILYLSKRYPEQYERERGKKAVQCVTLMDGLRRRVETDLDGIAPADPVEFAALMAAYTAGQVPEEPKEKPKKKREDFRKPTKEEISDYCKQELYEIDTDAFWDHYETCGWVVGKNKPMKNWKAAVRQWNRRQGEFAKEIPKEESKRSSFDTDTFFEAAVRNSYGSDYDRIFGGDQNEESC